MEQQEQQRHDEQLQQPQLLSFDIGVGEDSTNQQTGSAQGEQAPHGYDVLVRVVQAHGLVSSDWWNGLSDPYVVLQLRGPEPGGGGGAVKYRTRTVFRDLNPQYDEFFEAGNVQPGSQLEVQVWDKDTVTPDDELGRATWVFEPQADGAAAGLTVRLLLAHSKQRGKDFGELELEVHHRPSAQPGLLRMLGPVRFRQQLSPVSGLLTGHWTDPATLAFSTYKLFLCGVADVFDGVRHTWNRAHAAAAHIYRNPVLLAGVRQQHAALYATRLGRSRAGVLRGPPDFFALLGWGVRAGQRRYYTYSLLPDSLRLSETGAGFFTDYMSKHAMHAGGAEEVLFAGEFCIVPEEFAPGGYKLVIDNNSGTFAPKAEHLPLMARLFTANFPDMMVETVTVGDPKLDEYHRQCPSRLRVAEAAAAAAEAVAAADAAALAKGAGKQANVDAELQQAA